MRHIVLSLDGLSIDDATVLQGKLGSLKALVQSGSINAWDAGILTSTQPIWCEILTGVPWYTNGCSGYAKPSGSLNRLEIFSEKDLLAPLALLQEGSKMVQAVTINIPVLMPSEQSRIWVSDGSLPINRTISPSQLLSKSQFESYAPRPYADMGKSMEVPNKSAANFLDNEIKRLELALELFENSDWDRFVYRVSVFDHLSHLLGLNFLSAKDLQTSEALERFLEQLDSAISRFANCSDVRLMVLSSYSHITCRGTLNLNVLLEQGGFLRLENNIRLDRNKSMRLDAMKAIGAAPIASQLASTEGRLIGGDTTAASPISGGVFVNRKSFEDGAVNEHDYEDTRIRVRNFLHDELSKRFGSGFSIDTKPPPQDSSSAEIPDFMVKIEGIEFRNMQENIAGRLDVPRTTHSSAGFIVRQGARNSGEVIRPTQLRQLLLD